VTTYFDPNDPPQLQVTVFPTRPDALLVRAVGAQEFWVPPLRLPLDRPSVAAAFAAHDIPAQVVETTPDTVTRSQRDARATISVARSAEKDAQRGREVAEASEKRARSAMAAAETAAKDARRAQLEAEAKLDSAKQQIAVLKVKLSDATAPPGPRVNLSATAHTDAQRRDELVRAKIKTESEITQLNKLLRAEVLAITNRAEKQQRLDDLRVAAHAIDRELRELKARFAVKTAARTRPHPTAASATPDAARRFVEIARPLLGPEMADEVWRQIERETAESGDESQGASS